VTDPSISKLSETLIQNLHQEQEKLREAGEDLEETTKYISPNSDSVLKVNQNIRFNLIRAKNSDSSTPTLQLFKSFASALHNSDQFLSILPVHSSKQTLPSLSNKTQISKADKNKMHLFFKQYYNKQDYSLSGFFHVSTSLSLEELIESPKVFEWLETQRYSIKPSPSNADEREDLKLAIIQLPSWVFPTLPNPLVIHLTKGDFKGPQKSTKMIFVCSERSTQTTTSKFFSRLYDGTSTEYPNGIMMLLIPLNPNIMYKPSYHQKVIYNHEQYLGEETCMCIHGFHDLSTIIKLKNSQEVSLRMLLHSLPASQGMSWPQLFQLVEPNPAGAVVLITFQQCDKDLVFDRRMSLESDISAQLAHGEAAKAFLSEIDGISFNDVHCNSKGRFSLNKQSSKEDHAHILHTHSILSPPPKKRSFNPTPPAPLAQPTWKSPSVQQSATVSKIPFSPPLLTQKVKQMEHNLLLQFQ
jgi:hypothetical protein